MELKNIKISIPDDVNIIIGQSHFIKTIEDVYESLVNSVPNIKFGIAFCESSQKCLVRYEGNDDELTKLAYETAYKISAGHCFIIFIKNAYPINVLKRIQQVPEVCNIYCATSNPLEVIIAETEQGIAIIGIIDGFKSRGIESSEDKKERISFLRKIGYKVK